MTNHAQNQQVRLQGIGWKDATPAGCLRAGNRIVYNYGETAEVLRIVAEGPRTITVDIIGADPYVAGETKVYRKHYNRTTLVVVA